MAKQALLVVSFGTSYHETYHKTIEAIENDLKAAFPEADFFHAYTSKMIISKLKKRDGIAMDTPVEALEKIKAGGYTEGICQATHIINGHEFYRMIREMRPYQDVFERFIVGRPLLSSHADFEAMAGVLADLLPPLSPVDAWVFMGHGTDHHANSCYPAMDHYLKACGSNLFMATVEGYPTLKDVTAALYAGHYRRVGLMPFMVVAGDHALNDMAGADGDSWQSRLRAEGFDVASVVRGLGEYPSVRAMFIDHAQNGTELKELI